MTDLDRRIGRPEAVLTTHEDKDQEIARLTQLAQELEARNVELRAQLAKVYRVRAE